MRGAKRTPVFFVIVDTIIVVVALAKKRNTKKHMDRARSFIVTMM
jgi:hypothetical protein